MGGWRGFLARGAFTFRESCSHLVEIHSTELFSDNVPTRIENFTFVENSKNKPSAAKAERIL